MNNIQKISCDHNLIQSCHKTCIPKLKYFGITDSMILSKELDSNGNIKTFNIDPCYPNPPKLTVKDGVAMYYSNIDQEYVNFDSTLYDNIYVKAYKDNIGGDSSSYSISIEPLDCSKKAIISNMTLYRPNDYFIKDIFPNGEHIELYSPVSELTSNMINSNIDKLMNLPISSLNKKICQKSLFFNLDSKNINLINGCDYNVFSIDMKKDSNSIISVLEGKLQYLDSSGKYNYFNSYDNIKLNLFPLDSVYTGLSIDKSSAIDFLLKISPLDPSKPMILGDKVIFPFQNYEINDILDDGTIEYNNIPNYLSILLN